MLTIQSFAWTSAGVTRQRSLLGSSANRANLARQIAAAVRDRGADGVNLDFEPIISTYSDEFTALVRSVRAELNKIARGYQLTFDATGWIGNYPIGDATASGGADAVVIMGYDYRTGSSNAGRLGRADRRPDLRHRRHDPRVSRPRARLPRSSLASRTTDGPGRRPRRGFMRGTSREPSTAHRPPSSTARPSSSPPTTGATGTPSRASPGPSTGARTAPRRTAASTRGASCTTTTRRRSG